MTQFRSGLHAANRQAQAALCKTLPAMLLRTGLSPDHDQPLRIERAPAPTAPTQMAAAQSRDEATREQLAPMYASCLQTYRGSIRPQDTESDDAGAAMAFFIIANLHALRTVQTSQPIFDTLEQQLRGVTRRSAEWDRATLQQRQFFFERLAILGVLMIASYEKAKAEGPAAMAELRRTARQYLQQMLGLNPDSLTIGPDGLVMRGC